MFEQPVRLFERALRRCHKLQFFISSEFLKSGFKFSGAKLWNSLLLQAKLAQSEYTFKMNINSLDT